MLTQFHAIMVGAGPAGLLAAWRGDVLSSGLLVVDAGEDVAQDDPAGRARGTQATAASAMTR